MMGSDGKYYRVDMRNNFTDQKEVYGVTPSQLAVYDNGSMKKSRLGGGGLTATMTRPTSSKSNLRPNSASRFWIEKEEDWWDFII